MLFVNYCRLFQWSASCLQNACKYCSTEIYLQYIPVTPTFQWISFEASDTKLHLCPKKTLGPRIKQLIQNAIEKMNYSNTHKVSPLLKTIEMTIEIFEARRY